MAKPCTETQGAFDDITGEELESEEAKKASPEGIGWLSQEGTEVYKKVNRSEAHKPNFQRVAVRWIDVNNGDEVSKKYRSGWTCGQEISSERRHVEQGRLVRWKTNCGGTAFVGKQVCDI